MVYHLNSFQSGTLLTQCTFVLFVVVCLFSISSQLNLELNSVSLIIHYQNSNSSVFGKRHIGCFFVLGNYQATIQLSSSDIDCLAGCLMHFYPRLQSHLSPVSWASTMVVDKSIGITGNFKISHSPVELSLFGGLQSVVWHSSLFVKGILIFIFALGPINCLVGSEYIIICFLIAYS